ncbi:MAG: hypothetical protein Unbinned5081contig1002_30 [Prokaryotic dsDNA virus sp.]|nr:MAG: hypothetical protein Unbinned5081contig1002_30 [Prokaryotic dsDNA virus sp.]
MKNIIKLDRYEPELRKSLLDALKLTYIYIYSCSIDDEEDVFDICEEKHVHNITDIASVAFPNVESYSIEWALDVFIFNWCSSPSDDWERIYNELKENINEIFTTKGIHSGENPFLEI